MAMQHPTLSQLRELAQTLGFELERDELAVYHEIIADSMDIYRALDELPDHLPPVHYPRTPGYRPEGEENQYGAWYYKT